MLNKAAYIILGVGLDGIKEVLDIWVGENERSKYWLNVLNDLRNRGAKDLLIVCIDGLPSFNDTIKVVFPNTEIQRCIVHQIRNSTKYLSYKDRKEFCSNLKDVYEAVNKEAASSSNGFKR